MEEYTGIIFDSNDEVAIYQICNHLVEHLNFNICYNGKEIPGFMVVKKGKESLELLEQTIESYCKKEKLRYGNIVLFHGNNLHITSENDCFEWDPE